MASLFIISNYEILTQPQKSDKYASLERYLDAPENSQCLRDNWTYEMALIHHQTNSSIYLQVNSLDEFGQVLDYLYDKDYKLIAEISSYDEPGTWTYFRK